MADVSASDTRVTLPDLPDPAPRAAAPPQPGAGATDPAADWTGDYADFPVRFGGFFVDLLIVFLLARIPAQIVHFVTHLLDRNAVGPTWLRPAAAICLPIIITFIALIYRVSLETSARQGTLGKQVFGLVVTDLRGRRISVFRSMVRFFSQFLSLLCCGIGYLLPLVTSRKQTLHDVVSGCVVVRK